MLLTQKIFNIENPKLQNNPPTELEIDEWNKLLDKHHNRGVSLQQMSGFRNRGQFEISQRTFDILTKLFSTIINTIERERKRLTLTRHNIVKSYTGRETIDESDFENLPDGMRMPIKKLNFLLLGTDFDIIDGKIVPLKKD